MNCFYCTGHEVVCPSYFGAREEQICAYKNVANNDLKKFDENRTDLTLIDMLQEYKGIKIVPKELATKK